MTNVLATRFEIPIEVTAKRVGNMLGCAIQTLEKAAETPNLAMETRTGKPQPEARSSSLRMQRIARLATPYRLNKNTNTVFFEKYLSRAIAKMGAGKSAMDIMIVFVKKSPGRYLD